MQIGKSGVVISKASLWIPLLISSSLFAQAPLNVSFMSGFTENAALSSDINLEVFRKELQANNNVAGSWIQGEMGTSVPLKGLNALPASKVLVACTRRITLSAGQLDTVKNYVSSGGGIVGLRAQIHGFQNWYEFGKLLGGEYLDGSGKPLETYALWGSGAQSVAIKSGAAGHPVLAGFIPYSSSSTMPKNVTLAPDVKVLLEGTVMGDDKKSHTEPVAWVRELPSGQRIFYTSLEHKNDWSNASYMKMMVNAVNWVSHRTGGSSSIHVPPSPSLSRKFNPGKSRFVLVFEKGRIRLVDGDIGAKAALSPLGRWDAGPALSR